jgi:hypothetical protein
MRGKEGKRKKWLIKKDKEVPGTEETAPGKGWV